MFLAPWRRQPTAWPPDRPCRDRARAPGRGRSRRQSRTVPAAAGTLARPRHQRGTAASDRSRDEESGPDLRIRAIADRHVVPGRRAANTGTSSAKPATRLTSPRPLMAPRAKLFVTRAPKRRPCLGEVVPLPESRPGQDDEQQSHLDEERHTQQATEEQSAPPPSDSVTDTPSYTAVHPRILHLAVHGCPLPLASIPRGANTSSHLD